jgi:2-keto-4-pentenoate hydratase/2-oxohepta-3-ene-1,7-dioic acid hydratase in catechol pathway
MRLLTFATDGRARVGIAVGRDGIVDLSRVRPDLPTDMIGLMEIWPQVEGDLRKFGRDDFHYVFDHVIWKAPVPRPQKILAIGLNYADHVAESGQPVPDKQIWFSKLPSAVNPPFEIVRIPKASEQVDYEAELVVVIGKRCRHVKKEDAASVVFGYACGNDVSVRDWQFQTSQWLLGKSFDTHAPFGPWITTPDEVGDPHALGIRCFVNEEKRQDSNTKNLVFDVYDQIAHLSEVMTLVPGDVIFTGTPGGVGFAAKPPRWLKPEDRVRVEIDRLGAIEALVRME